MSEIESELKIDSENLSEELANQAATYVYHAEKAVSAEAEYNSFKTRVGELYAMLDKEVRAQAEADKKKITEKVVENTILQHKDYKAALDHLGRLKANMDILKARREGMRERGAMLVQMCSMKRTEMEAISFSSIKSASA